MWGLEHSWISEVEYLDQGMSEIELIRDEFMSQLNY